MEQEEERVDEQKEEEATKKERHRREIQERDNIKGREGAGLWRQIVS